MDVRNLPMSLSGIKMCISASMIEKIQVRRQRQERGFPRMLLIYYFSIEEVRFNARIAG